VFGMGTGGTSAIGSPETCNSREQPIVQQPWLNLKIFNSTHQLKAENKKPGEPIKIDNIKN
jgi:hypothetical protein